MPKVGVVVKEGIKPGSKSKVAKRTKRIGPCTIYEGDNREVMRSFSENHFHSIVCDPPYGLSKTPDMAEVLKHWLAGDDYTHTGGGFMGKSWDSFVPGPKTWEECYRVLKPGGHALVFAGTRTVDLMGISLRLAGFEVRDMLAFAYLSGFPKSLNISFAIDKAAGAKREVLGKSKPKTSSSICMSNSGQNKVGSQKTFHGGPVTDEAEQWDGWGSCLKPAMEPILLCRKPLDGTLAQNTLTHGAGGLNVDGCRIGGPRPYQPGGLHRASGTTVGGFTGVDGTKQKVLKEIKPFKSSGSGRYNYHTKEKGTVSGVSEMRAVVPGLWPANILLDGDDETLGIFQDNARFFFNTKASRWDREFGLNGESQQRSGVGALRDGGRESLPRANTHPTVKSTSLMCYLCRLVTPKGGIILDPFMGSGSTGLAAVLEGFNFVGCEIDATYFDISDKRLSWQKEQMKFRTKEELEIGEQLL